MGLFGGALGGVVGGAVVRLTLDKSEFDAGLAQARGQTQAGATGFGKFSGAAKAAFAVAGIAALKFGADSIKAFSEAQQIAAQTDAVLTSTGHSANVTATEVEGLANEIRNLSGIDDEAVQASENLLLTFRDIRNEAGAGNDIFNQTTMAIADMATAMNQGAIPSQEQLAQTTIQVGKAMNDPIKGMTALRRVGVAFSDAQVSLITHLQETGDLMGAQKLILQELTKEFGGAAEAAGNTFAGSMAKAQGKLDDFKETVGATGAALLLLATGDLKGAASLITEVTNVTVGANTAFRDLIAAHQAETEAAIASIQPTLDEIDAFVALVSGTNEVSTSAEQAAFAEKGLADAMRELNDVTRAHWALSNQAAGGLLGLVSASMDAHRSQDELAAAQAKVNQMQENGKQGTKAYAQAIRDRNDAEIQSIQSQQNLEGSAQSLYAQFQKGNVSLKEADARLRAQAAAAGLSAGRTNDLVDKVNALYAADARIPKDVTTNFQAPGLDMQMSQLVQYWTTLQNIPTHKDVFIVTHYSQVGTPGTAGGPQ